MTQYQSDNQLHNYILITRSISYPIGKIFRVSRTFSASFPRVLPRFSGPTDRPSLSVVLSRFDAFPRLRFAGLRSRRASNIAPCIMIVTHCSCCSSPFCSCSLSSLLTLSYTFFFLEEHHIGIKGLEKDRHSY